jgi:phenylpyruvate tautomerase PptA (4-oxalocrotonate tautomerase family)
MPLARISVPRHRSATDRSAISAGIHAALQEAFNVPADDLFHLVTEHEPGIGILRGDSYLGIAYSDDLTIIQITVSDTRTIEQKKTLYRLIARNLAAEPGLRPQDILMNLVEVKKENWSFGNGAAQYA